MVRRFVLGDIARARRDRAFARGEPDSLEPGRGRRARALGRGRDRRALTMRPVEPRRRARPHRAPRDARLGRRHVLDCDAPALDCAYRLRSRGRAGRPPDACASAARGRARGRRDPRGARDRVRHARRRTSRPGHWGTNWRVDSSFGGTYSYKKDFMMRGSFSVLFLSIIIAPAIATAQPKLPQSTIPANTPKDVRQAIESLYNTEPVARVDAAAAL